MTMVALPATAASAAIARRRIADDLSTSDLSAALVDDAVLVASELVSNAVRHASALAGGELVVAWDLDRHGVIVRVTDGGGRNQPHLLHPTARDPNGRGLALVEALSTRWGVVTGATSTTVWASLSC